MLLKYFFLFSREKLGDGDEIDGKKMFISPRSGINGLLQKLGF